MADGLVHKLAKLAVKFLHMNKLLFFLLLPFASFAQTPNKEFKLKGEAKLAKPIDWIFLRYAKDGQYQTDSLQTKNGEFKFEGQIAEPTVANLWVRYERQTAEEKGKLEYVQIFLEPTKLELKAKDSLKNFTITGSPAQADFAALQKQQEVYEPRMNKLYEDYSRFKKAGMTDSMKLTETAIDDLQKEADERVFGNYVKTHPSSPLALYALKQYAGWEIDPVKVEPLFNSLPAETRAYPSAETLKFQIETAKKTAIGNYAMDFTQADTVGTPVSLSSFKGKYVLVDFWASWCGPCRAENPNVVKAFNKYKDKNFTILGVSLDRPNARDRWMKAIHDDGLTWNHVSDLKYWDNAVAKQYAIRAIPQNLLIDPQGKIVAKNLNGEELEKKLSEYLQ
jgi:peroxiredoxin